MFKKFNLFGDAESNFIKKFDEFEKVSINNYKNIDLVLYNLNLSLSSDEYRNILHKRKKKNKLDYDFFKSIFLVNENICQEILNYYVNRYQNPIGKGRSEFSIIKKLLDDMIDLNEFDKVAIRFQVNEDHIKNLKKEPLKKLKIILTLMNILIGKKSMELDKKKENPFILKQHRDLSDYLTNKYNYLEKFEKGYTDEEFKAVIEEILNKKYLNIYGIEIHLNDLRKLLTDSNFEQIQEYKNVIMAESKKNRDDIYTIRIDNFLKLLNSLVIYLESISKNN